MNPKIFIATLSIIILSFVGQGLKVVSHVESVLDNNLLHQKSTVEDIGMVFDWYGLTIVDSIVKKNHNMITHDEMISILKKGQKQKNELLIKYYALAEANESTYVSFLKESDAKLDTFIEKVISTEVKLQSNEIISEMYQLTDPTVETINKILLLKTDNAAKNVAKIHKELDNFKAFLYLAGALSVVITLPLLFQKKKNNKNIIAKIKAIKKKAIAEERSL